MHTNSPVRKFISLDDEVMLRILFKDVLEHQGPTGLLQALGELNVSAIVGLEVYREWLDNDGKVD